MKNKMPDSRIEKATPFSHAEIIEIERQLGRKLPTDYCRFVQEFGGAFVGGSIDGSTDLPILAFFRADNETGILYKLRAHPDLQEDGVLPIADCELNNLYVLDNTNAVFYINYYGGRTTASKVSNSFQDFVDRIVVDE
jgi:hypothetical protein